MRLVEGQLVHSRYRLDQRLAQGGMGEVWKGFDIQLRRVVAIKALRGDLNDAKELEARRRRLRMEAHNSADLAHPNIAALFEYYEHDNIGFLIMEYVDSKSLADLYREQTTMDPLELLPILVQVARGLYVAHSHGIIHRDVKPANIMVSQDGEVKITDFGVSYSTNQAQITQDGMVVGTAQYISPEQAQGNTATPQSDIYSLGVVAYEGLSGQRPFTGATPVDIAAAHVNETPPPLPSYVDVQLAQFVMSMLSKDPLDRPKDALVVARTLSRIERRLFDQESVRNGQTIISRDGRIARRVVSAPYTDEGTVAGGGPSTLITAENDLPSKRQAHSDGRNPDHAGQGTDAGSSGEQASTNAAETSDTNAVNADQAQQLSGFSPTAQKAMQTMSETLRAINNIPVSPAGDTSLASSESESTVPATPDKASPQNVSEESQKEQQ
jgi:eukaryotic-like serine/threonine-protein kinase